MPRRRSLILASTVASAAFALLAAGCGGGGSSPGVASVSASDLAALAAHTGLVPFTDCMRSHGVRNFPDPDSSGEIPKSQVVAAAQANLGKFNAAQTACIHLAPGGSLAAPQSAQQERVQLADELSFARCMRGHGVARFPDPTARDGLTIAMVEAQGIDVHSPTVLRVVQKCLPASHGALTMQKVNEAINHAGG
jgi:hypothetical protein